VGDSLKDYGVDEVGGRCHDLLGTRWVASRWFIGLILTRDRCDPYGKISFCKENGQV